VPALAPDSGGLGLDPLLVALPLELCALALYGTRTVSAVTTTARRPEHEPMRKPQNKTALAVLKVYGPVTLLVLVGFVVAYQFVDPAPPRILTLSAGPADGAYVRFARRYAELLAHQGIVLHVQLSAGSVQNLRRLATNAVDVAFVQGGTEHTVVGGHMYSLGSLYYEPVWIFYRGERRLERLTELPNLRIAVGPVGSGSRAMAETLMADNALPPDSVRLSDLGGQQAAAALLNGEVDAVLVVAGPDAAVVQRLIHAPGVRLMSFRRAGAYSRRHPYLSEVVLPEGILDLANNVPAEEIHLVAATANLVVHGGVHPALIDQLLQALRRTHEEGGWLESSGEFPAPRQLVFPLSPEAERFFQHGPPLLQRYLPFWGATLLDRLKVMLVPLVVMLLPLMKIMPHIYTWRMRAKIYRWYRELEAVETTIQAHLDPTIRQACLKDLDRIEEEVAKVHVPLSFAAQAYDLRLHVGLVRESLRDMDPSTAT
jgi:TRAP-type uncharacterized transport system substrate-binding protein